MSVFFYVGGSQTDRALMPAEHLNLLCFDKKKKKTEHLNLGNELCFNQLNSTQFNYKLLLQKN